MRRSILATWAAAGLLAASFTAIGATQAQQAQPTANHLTLYVMADDMGLVGPDGKHHDSIIPSSFVLKAGEKVVLTIVNYDDMMHSITAPGLNLNVMIKAAKHVAGSDEPAPVTTTYTFTPTKKGQFRWNCAIPCDKGDGHGWAMSKGFDGHSRDGFMAGYIEVI